jgi:glycosyltransferase involved in cell wall biosynthesis
VVDSAALLFDPYSTDEMVRAISDLLIHPELKARMERLGLQRASLFSWQKSAQTTLDVYCEVAEAAIAKAPRARPAAVAP